MPRLRDLSFDLPPQLVDVTDHYFTSETGPILKMPLSILPLAANEVDPFLRHTRAKLTVFPKAKSGELETFENPNYLVRGFATDFGSTVVIDALLPFEGGALYLQPKCVPGPDTELRALFRSLNREGASAAPLAPGTHRYHALGFHFDSHQKFESPSALSLEGPDRLRIFGRADKKPIRPKAPDWSAAFALQIDTVVSVTLEQRLIVKGRATVPGGQVPSFNVAAWVATADTQGELRQLTYSDAICRGRGQHFRFELCGEGPSAEQLDLWRAFLASARWS